MAFDEEECKAEIAQLLGALKPFAIGAKEIPENWPDGRGLLIPENHPDNPKRHALLLAFVEDFRKARRAYEQAMTRLDVVSRDG